MVAIEDSAHSKVDIEQVSAVTQEKHRQEVELFGVKLLLERKFLFIILSVGSLVSAASFAALQEAVFRIPGFKFGGWLTLGTMLTYCACAGVELGFSGAWHRRGSIKDYMILSVLTMGGMYFTNWSLNFLNYATRIVFKSSKVVPTMIFGTAVQGRLYTVYEYLSAVVLVLGIVLFTLGDADASPNFHVFGVGLIALGIGCDALTSNFEEARFFRVEQPSSQAEVIFYSSLIGAMYGMAVLTWTGEVIGAVKHTQSHPVVLLLIVGSSVMGYLSVSFVLLLITHFGATNTEIVKSLRKVISILVSFMVYPKPLNWKYCFGFLACLGSLYATHLSRNLKSKRCGEVM